MLAALAMEREAGALLASASSAPLTWNTVAVGAVGLLVGFVIWYLKQLRTEAKDQSKLLTTSIEKMDKKLTDGLEKQANAHLSCREDIISRLEDKADRDKVSRDIGVVHGRLDAYMQEVAEVKGVARGIELAVIKKESHGAA